MAHPTVSIDSVVCGEEKVAPVDVSPGTKAVNVLEVELVDPGVTAVVKTTTTGDSVVGGLLVVSAEALVLVIEGMAWPIVVDTAPSANFVSDEPLCGISRLSEVAISDVAGLAVAIPA